MGTLLGPPLMRRSGRVQMNMEVPPDRDVDSLMIVGKQHRFDVSYRASLPEPLEAKAIIWALG